MTAYPASTPPPGVPIKKRRGILIGSILMIAGVIGGVGFGASGAVKIVDALGGTYYEIELDAPFTPVEKFNGIYSTSQYTPDVRLTANGKLIAGASTADSSVESEFSATVKSDVGEIKVYQAFTFDAVDGQEYVLESGLASSGDTFFVGPGVSDSTFISVALAFLLGGLLFLVGLIVLIVSVVRRKRDRNMAAAIANGPYQQGMPPSPYGAPPAYPPAPAPSPYAPPPPANYPPPPPADYELPSSSTSGPGDDPGADGWAAPEPPTG